RVGGPGVLPYDRVLDRAAGRTRPDHRGLALVADPDRGQRTAVRVDRAQGDPDARPHALEDLVGVVLDPAGTRRDLGVSQLMAGGPPPRPAQKEAAAARRAPVDGG